jgi:hypothetical protein
MVGTIKQIVKYFTNDKGQSEAGAALRYGSGSNKTQLRLRNILVLLNPCCVTGVQCINIFPPSIRGT